MKFVKTLKDCKLSHKQQVFAGYIKDKVDSYVCYDQVTNLAYMRQYLLEENEFTVYSTAVGQPPHTLLKNQKAIS